MAHNDILWCVFRPWTVSFTVCMLYSLFPKLNMLWQNFCDRLYQYQQTFMWENFFFTSVDQTIFTRSIIKDIRNTYMYIYIASYWQSLTLSVPYEQLYEVDCIHHPMSSEILLHTELIFLIPSYPKDTVSYKMFVYVYNTYIHTRICNVFMQYSYLN